MSAVAQGRNSAGHGRGRGGVSGRRLRRDTPILIPASLLVFAALAAITLLSYRGAIAGFTAEREQASLAQASALAEAARILGNDDWTVLSRALPPGTAMAIYDDRGIVRSSFGFGGPDALAIPLPRAGEIATPRVEGFGRLSATSAAPDSREASTIRALVPFARAGKRFLLRVETQEPTLFAQQRSLRILTPVVFGLSLAIALLAIFFLRALVRPYEELLEKARSAAPPVVPADSRALSQGSGDDVEFLLATFDRALAALRTESGSAAVVDQASSLADLSAVERTLGAQLESGLLMFDRDGQLLAANPSAVELLGDPTPDTGGDPALRLVRARAAISRHSGLVGLLATAFRAGKSIPRASVTLDRPDRQVELGLTLQALRPVGAVGAPGFLALLADVTDLTRREAEERFASGLAQLGELSAGVAHELRNSLATMQGYLELASRRDLPTAASEEIAEARREAVALARIVDDFLTFARPGPGAAAPVDVVALLQRATTDPALAGVRCDLLLPGTPVPDISGDAHLLQRALRNLLLNAAQATRARAAQSPPSEPPPIRVRLSLDTAPSRARGEELATGAAPSGTPAAFLTITIEDRGTGLSPEIAARLFEPFASCRPGGAGLGLALARRIVLMHGGTLQVLPGDPDGVRAEIRLPAVTIVTTSNQLVEFTALQNSSQSRPSAEKEKS
ncbi:MAG: ATP-binding protein [Thermoanaerobaculia bacterium]